MKRIMLFATMTLLVVVAMTMISTANLTHAQAPTQNPTDAQQTLNAIIFPRLTLTARGIAARTSTFAANLTNTMNAGASETANIFNIDQTATVLALTYTPTPSTTLTPTVSPTATITLTASLTPSPMNATDQYNTIVAIANSRLTGTAAVNQTVSVQRTIDAIIGGTLQFTATPSITPSPIATATLTQTATLSPLNVQNTLDAQVGLSLSQTPIAAVSQTAAASFKQTVESLVGGNQTATALAIRAALSVRIAPMTALNAAKVISAQTVKLEGVGKAIAFNGIGDEFGLTIGNSVSLWSVLNTQRVRNWVGLTDRESVAISDDGSRLAVSSTDGTIRLYDLNTGVELPVLQGHTGSVLRVLFSPDGKLLASSGVDKSVRIWNAQTGAPIRVLTNKEVRTEVPAIAFSPAGNVLTAASRDGRIINYELNSGVPVVSVRTQRQTSDIAYSPDGKLIAVSGDTNAIVILQADNNKALQVITTPFQQVAGLVFTRDSVAVIAGGSTGRIAIQEALTGKLLVSLQGHTGAITALAISPDGTRLISLSRDGTLRVWAVTDPPTSTPTSTLTPSATRTYTPTATNTPLPTRTNTLTRTQTPTPSNTPTRTPTVTYTPTFPPIPTNTRRPVVSPTPTKPIVPVAPSVTARP